MNVLRDFVNLVQRPVDSEPDNALVPLGFDVNVARPLVKGIAEEMVHRIDDVLVVGGQFVGSPEPHILLEVPQVNERGAELVLGRHDRSLETEKLIDDLDNVRLRAHHGLDFHVGDLGDVVDDFHIERIGGGHGQAVFFDRNRQDKVFSCKGMGNRGGDEIEVQLKRVDFYKRDLPCPGKGLVNRLFVQKLGAIVRPFQLKRGNDVDDRDRVADPAFAGRLPDGPDLLELDQETVLLGHDFFALILVNQAELQKDPADVLWRETVHAALHSLKSCRFDKKAPEKNGLVEYRSIGVMTYEAKGSNNAPFFHHSSIPIFLFFLL